MAELALDDVDERHDAGRAAPPSLVLLPGGSCGSRRGRPDRCQVLEFVDEAATLSSRCCFRASERRDNGRRSAAGTFSRRWLRSSPTDVADARRDDHQERGVSLILLCWCSCARRALDYDAEQFKRGSEMPKRPDVGAIAEQVIERLKQIEDQLTQNQRIADELGRLRDVVNDLERAIVSRFSGEPVPAAEPTEGAPRQRAAKRSRAATRPSAAKRATAPRGQNQAKISQRCRGASR